MKPRHIALGAIITTITLLAGCAPAKQTTQAPPLPEPVTTAPVYTPRLITGTDISLNRSDWAFTSANTSAEATEGNRQVATFTDATFTTRDATTGEIHQNPYFGSYEVSNDEPFTVTYNFNPDLVWSDGTPVTDADALLEWYAHTGKTNTFRPAPASITQWQRITQQPETESSSFSITYITPYADWELLDPVGVSAHGTYALAYPDTFKSVQDAHNAYQENPTDALRNEYLNLAAEYAADANEKVTTAITEQDTTVLERLGEVWTTGYSVNPRNPATSLSLGAYTVSGEDGTDTTLTANPFYKFGPAPYVETFTIHSVDPLATEPETDVLGSPQPTVVAPEGHTTVTTGANYTRGLYLNSANGGPFDPATYDDASTAQKVREAFLASIPTSEIADALGEPEITGILTLPGQPGYNRAADPERGVETAKALLQEAGVISPTVELWYPEFNPAGETIASRVKASAEKAGFRVDVKPNLDWTGLTEDNTPFDATIRSFTVNDRASVQGWVDLYDSKVILNPTGYSDTKLRALLNEVLQATDREEQQAIAEKIEAKLKQSATVELLTQPQLRTIVAPTVTGVEASPIFYDSWYDWKPTS